MTRLLPLALLLLGACQQAAAPADEAANANTVAPNSTEPAIANAVVPPPAADDPVAPEPAPIPTKFRGLWAETQTACGQLTHHSRLVISGRTIRFPDFVLSVDTVDLPTEDSFAVKGRNKQTKTATEAHYSLDATGNILTDEAGGGAVRVRCG